VPKFKVESKSSLSQAEAYSRMKQLLESDQDLRKMDASCKVSFNDNGHTGIVKGSKFSAELCVTGQGAGSHVTIEVDLPLMLLPAKGMVQSALEKKMSKVLA
jgi:hypothetical protein